MTPTRERGRTMLPTIRSARYELADTGEFCRCLNCRVAEWVFDRLGYEWVPDRCCDLHVPDSVGYAGAITTAMCCDPDDCGPCCEDCPTCPVRNTEDEQRAADRCGALAGVELVAAVVGVWLGWRWFR